MKSTQELDWLLNMFIQLEVKVMNSSYKDSQLHSVQGYQPLHGSDDYGQEIFGTFPGHAHHHPSHHQGFNKSPS